MVRLKIKESKDMYDIISETEDTIIQSMETEKTDHANKNKFNQRSTESNKKRWNKKSSNQTKWCTFHKTDRHSNEECRSQLKNRTKNQKESSTEKDPSKTYALQEPMIRNHPCLLNVRLKDRDFQAVVDSGSMENFISDKIIKKLDIKTEEITSNKSEVELLMEI